MTRAARPNPVSRESLQRCALRAQLRGDPMIGSAFPAAKLLLVEQPGGWGRDGLRESRFGAELAGALERRANAAGMRVQAIRQPGRTAPDAARRWLIVDTRPGHESIRRGEFTLPAELSDLPLDGSTGRVDSEAVYLVCAHSKHDACCAIRGRNMAAALEAVRPGRVFECSHLGGDRFAPNVLVLPHGLLYGRVLPFAAAEFADVAERDEVVPALLRGHVGMPSPAQAALASAYEHLGLRDRRALRFVSMSPMSMSPVQDGAATVRLLGPDGEFDVRVQVDRVAAEGLTCGNPGPNSYFRYRATL